MMMMELALPVSDFCNMSPNFLVFLCICKLQAYRRLVGMIQHLLLYVRIQLLLFALPFMCVITHRILNWFCADIL